MPLPVELLTIGLVALLLVGSIALAWRDGVFDDPDARRAGIAGGIVALIAMGVNGLYDLPWLLETVVVVSAVLAVSLGIRYGDRVRGAVGGR